MSKNDRDEQVSRRERAQRGLYLYLSVLFVTVCWATILYFGGKAAGVPIATGWLVAFAGAIFFLLLRGLGLVAVASGSAGEDDRTLTFDLPASTIAVAYHPSASDPVGAGTGIRITVPPVEPGGGREVNQTCFM